jgi:hypothetical protein
MPESGLPHLFVSGFNETQEYQAPGGGPRLPVLARNRQTHGARLMRELRRLYVAAEAINRRRRELEIPQQAGFSIVVEIRPRGALHPDTVEWRRDGIEVLSFVSATDADVLVLHVPEGRLAAFESRVRAYLEKETRSGNPANMALVNAIERFRTTVFLDLWTAQSPPPEGDGALWFQVWLRSKGLPSAQVRDEFAVVAAHLAIEVEPGYVTFPGRVVVAVRATRAALEAAGELLDLVAEFRSVSATAEFFLGELSPGDQATWVQELEERLEVADDSHETRIALLDTGINRAHPLLVNMLDQTDMHAYEAAWGLADHDGHGTEMAGISMYGNLTNVLASNGPVLLSHVLESAKILPPDGRQGWRRKSDVMD